MSSVDDGSNNVRPSYNVAPIQAAMSRVAAAFLLEVLFTMVYEPLHMKLTKDRRKHHCWGVIILGIFRGHYLFTICHMTFTRPHNLISIYENETNLRYGMVVFFLFTSREVKIQSMYLHSF